MIRQDNNHGDGPDEEPRRKRQDRQRLRQLLLEGAISPPAVTADSVYFETLRKRP